LGRIVYLIEPPSVAARVCSARPLALARGVRHSKWSTGPFRSLREPLLTVEKHRHGATNKIDLYFDDRFTRFSNLVTDN
jgi:replicative DNA helicase